MRKASFAIIVGFVLLIVLALMLTQSVAVLQRVARVSEVKGAPQIVATGQQEAQPLGEMRLVQAGDKLITGGQGQLTLNWIDGTRIRLEPNTELLVEKCQVAQGAEYSSFRLDLGNVWIRVLKLLSQQDKFEIQTPTATAGVRGTIFAVEVASDGATEIQVYEGEVKVESGGKQLRVAKNHTAQLGDSSGVSEVVGFSEEDRQNWNQEIAQLGPYLDITSPENNAQFSGNVVTIKGRCEREAALMVNGQPVSQKFNGQFTASLQVPAEEEYFTVQAVATDHRGYSTEVSRHLRRAQ